MRPSVQELPAQFVVSYAWAKRTSDMVLFWGAVVAHFCIYISVTASGILEDAHPVYVWLLVPPVVPYYFIISSRQNRRLLKLVCATFECQYLLLMLGVHVVNRVAYFRAFDGMPGNNIHTGIVGVVLMFAANLFTLTLDSYAQLVPVRFRVTIFCLWLLNTARLLLDAHLHSLAFPERELDYCIGKYCSNYTQVHVSTSLQLAIFYAKYLVSCLRNPRALILLNLPLTVQVEARPAQSSVASPSPSPSSPLRSTGSGGGSSGGSGSGGCGGKGKGGCEGRGGQGQGDHHRVPQSQSTPQSPAPPANGRTMLPALGGSQVLRDTIHTIDRLKARLRKAGVGEHEIAGLLVVPVPVGT
jgi:hypothetical protein